MSHGSVKGSFSQASGLALYRNTARHATCRRARTFSKASAHASSHKCCNAEFGRHVYRSERALASNAGIDLPRNLPGDWGPVASCLTQTSMNVFFTLTGHWVAGKSGTALACCNGVGPKASILLPLALMEQPGPTSAPLPPPLMEHPGDDALRGDAPGEATRPSDEQAELPSSIIEAPVVVVRSTVDPVAGHPPCQPERASRRLASDDDVRVSPEILAQGCVTMKWPFPFTCRTQTPFRRGSLRRSSNLTWPNAVSLSSRLK